MVEKNMILKGNICYSSDLDTIRTLEHGYLVCREGICAGVYEAVPEEYQEFPVEDYGDRLIIPGLVDLHMHAPQYPFRGLGMDLELLDWLNTHTFPEEAKYRDLDYAGSAYSIFTEDLKKSATTRACIFATRHVPATELLMDLLERTGLKTMAGKVNMDRNAPDDLVEESAARSAEDTRRWLSETAGRYHNVQPILTPRFIPSCSDELMELLSEIQKNGNLPLQSHLSENQGEIAWVKELCPASSCYGDAYDRTGAFGGACKTIMAHCVWSGEEEQRLMKERGVYVAHCPQSNMNLSSGVAPVRQFLEKGIHVGLGSDIAAGFSLSILCAMSDAVQASKLRWRIQDESIRPLTIEEVFYLGTKGGGEFFGKVGSFEPEYELDAVVLDDSGLHHPQPLTVRERLERLIYLADDSQIVAKYVAGKKII